jgi:hypothetical protein
MGMDDITSDRPVVERRGGGGLMCSKAGTSDLRFDAQLFRGEEGGTAIFENPSRAAEFPFHHMEGIPFFWKRSIFGKEKKTVLVAKMVGG